MDDMKVKMTDKKKWLKERVVEEIDRAFRFGEESEREKLMEEFGRKDEITTFERATDDEIKHYGENLAGWCKKCSRPIEGMWVFFISFCPHCGRTIDWDSSRAEEGRVMYHEVEE